MLQISLATLKDIDLGKIDVAVQQHLKKVVEDCIDRPGNTTPREVDLRFIITPQCDENGSCESANIEFEIGSKIPKHRSRPINCGVRRGGHLLFNPLFQPELGTDAQATAPHPTGTNPAA